MNQATEQGGVSVDWMDAWEHPPQISPAVFVADQRAFDEHGALWGGWVDPSQPPEALEVAIEATVGAVALAHDAWVVTDQAHLGRQMIPEQLSVQALHRFATYQRPSHAAEAVPAGTTLADVVASLPSKRWDDSADLARDIVIVSGLLPLLDGLPDDWERYVDIDLDKLGHDAAVLSGLIVSDDGEITRGVE